MFIYSLEVEGIYLFTSGVPDQSSDLWDVYLFLRGRRYLPVYQRCPRPVLRSVSLLHRGGVRRKKSKTSYRPLQYGQCWRHRWISSARSLRQRHQDCQCPTGSSPLYWGSLPLLQGERLVLLPQFMFKLFHRFSKHFCFLMIMISALLTLRSKAACVSLYVHFREIRTGEWAIMNGTCGWARGNECLHGYEIWKLWAQAPKPP